ncbi:GNAT family N-acetyltransferase [Haloactinopolyspora alba]|nr:GNAT family N-acetyltransferase [Haloactinopolyspora alba]
MSDFTIRAALADDLEAAGQITVAAYDRDGHLDADRSYADELADTGARALQASVLVAVDADEAVLGTVTFCRAGSPYAELAQPGEAEFRMLAVSDAARRRGVGQGLVEACVDLARQHGDHTLVLSSQAGMVQAHRLYERLQFTRAPERDHEPVPGVHLLAYTRTL